MFCPTCGASVPDGATFCPDCGNPITPSSPAPQQPPAGFVQNVPPAAMGAAAPGMSRQETIALAERQGLGMKWYKFLIYFGLIAGGVFDILNGVMYLTGFIYETQGASASLVYHFYPALMPINILFGLATIALGVFYILDRILMAKFSVKAPKLYYLVNGVSIGVSVIYQIISALILGNPSVLISALFTTVLSGAFLFLNIKYFTRRTHLFVNA